MNKITWQAPEFKKHEKPKSWFAALWIIAGGLVAVAFIVGSLFMGLFIAIATIVVSLFAAKEPRTLSFSLDEEMLTINDKVYPLEEYASFWFFDREDHLILSLAPRGFRPYSKLIVPPEKASDVRLILRSVLEEEEEEESLVERFADWIRF